MEKLIKIKKGQGLYSKFLERLYLAWISIPKKSQKEYLPFSKFREKIPRSFQINKIEAMNTIFLLSELGLVSIQKRGIKLNYKIIENE